VGLVTVADLGGWPVVIQRLVAREDLSSEQASAAMAEILAGAASPVQIAGFAVALRMKGETVEEIAGLVSAMLRAADRLQLPPDLAAVDTCGTGGSAARQVAAFNVSTLTALVVAGAGAPVCKHGGRAATATSSSGDLLDRLGVAIDLGPEGVGRCVVEAGMGFCFAPRFHPAMRHAAPARKELGISTVFNLLGPLTNPAGVRRQVVGVNNPKMAESVLGVLRAKGTQRALVVHGHDGLDELTIATTSTVHQLDEDQVRTFVVDPADFGIASPGGPVEGGDVEANVRWVHRVLGGERGEHRDIVQLNAAAALVAAGRVERMADGFELAAGSIDGGGAGQVLERLVAVSQAARAESATA
jgi:anthranilate phosphoribosyltransferase